MGSISVERVREAFHALSQLRAEKGDFFLAAAQIVSQAMDCPWTAILPAGEATAGPEASLALYMEKADTAANRSAITAAAWQLISGRPEIEGQWTDVIVVDGLGRLDIRGAPCLDSEGLVRGHLLAMAPQLTERQHEAVAGEAHSEADSSAGFVESFMDLTAQRVGSRQARKDSRQNLRHSEDNFRHLIENMEQGFYLHKEQRPIFVNRAMSEMYGYDSPEELLEIGDLSVLWAAHERDRVQRIAKAREQGAPGPKSYECEGVKKDGTPIRVRITSQSVRWEGETLVGGTVDEITALKASEFELAEKSAVLEAILEAVPSSVALRDTDGRFVFINKSGAATHGLKPADFLSRTQLEVFGTNGPQGTENQGMEVVTTGKAVFDMDVKSERFPGQIYSYSFVPVLDGAGGVTGVVSTGRNISERKRDEIALRESEQALNEAQRIGRMGHWRIHPDKGIIELSDQACIIFGFPEGGRVQKLSAVHAGVSTEEQARISVARTAGVANHEAYRLQYRATMPNGEIKVLAGMGLPEYDEEGRGTTIKLYLPRATEQPDEVQNTVPASPGARDECVLIVEDDPDVRTLAIDLISELGYRVLEAGDGKAALNILERERHIDLLFTDVILPGGMNGSEIARRAPGHQPNIRIMYMSGYSHDALIHQGRMDDAVVLLQKPFRKAELAVKLREALERPPKADETTAS